MRQRKAHKLAQSFCGEAIMEKIHNGIEWPDHISDRDIIKIERAMQYIANNLFDKGDTVSDLLHPEKNNA